MGEKERKREREGGGREIYGEIVEQESVCMWVGSWVLACI